MSNVVIKPGARLRSAVSEVEVVIVRAGVGAAALTCGGEPMLDLTAEGTPTNDGPDVVLGKRYVDEESGTEVLCTKGGAGPLAIGAHELTVKGAKTLPSSD